MYSALLAVCLSVLSASSEEGRFEGRFYAGKGDVQYLQLLDIARRMFDADPEYQNVPMLYTPVWNGFVEGPTWNAWWIQNSYGTTYAALPFYTEPYITFLQNAQDLWFDQMGDGKRAGFKGWVGPDGVLCDAAAPDWIAYKQGDGRTEIHDWGMEFTAAGLLMQAELLLISRDKDAIAHYLPKLERCANFIETRRDPETDLFLAGPAGNLLAPSYAGWPKKDGTFGMAYLTGLSVTYIAALDRLIQVEKLAHRNDAAKAYQKRRDRARRGLQRMATDEGYFIRSLDPDGTPHGVYGALQHGYFEASPNHDAMAFRIVDDKTAERIYKRIETIPGLRPHGFIIPNYPSYDDMYEKPEGLWEFGRWVNGGHWSTCEARMILGYYRLGKHDDIRRSMEQLMTFARRFRMDNPLTDFGNNVYQPKEPINLCYDTFGPSAAMIRGLFEYLYRSDELVLIPHVPESVTALEQKFPIRFGTKRLYISTAGSGPVTGVSINGKKWYIFDATSIHLPHKELPEVARVRIALGGSKVPKGVDIPKPPTPRSERKALAGVKLSKTHRERAEALLDFCQRLEEAGLGATYIAAHARLAFDSIVVIGKRRELDARGRLHPLEEPSKSAADTSYEETADRLWEGLEKTLKRYTDSQNPTEKRVADLWRQL